MTLTAMLLAGGQSRRMGTDKALLSVAGEPLWQRQLRLLRELQFECVWVSARARPAWCPANIDIILDRPPARGPLGGLAAALARLETSHLFALAIDLPQMTAAHVKKLIGLIQPGCGVVPMKEEWFEPLCAIYPHEAAPLARAQLELGKLALQDLVRTLQKHNRVAIYPVPESEAGLYLNLNTPAS